MEQKRKYFAFISYSHKDSEMAKWLQHEFEFKANSIDCRDSIVIGNERFNYLCHNPHITEIFFAV